MQFSESWLREQLDIALGRQELLDRFTMAGLEVDGVEPVAGEFSGVIIGKVIATQPHPDADKLTCCEVDYGQEETTKVVCGAQNVVAGAKVAFAPVGATVGPIKIKKAKLRGVESFGMICSQKELGLADNSNGIWILPELAPIGICLKDYFDLDDVSICLDLTPNRGDCLSVRGLARDTAALCNVPLTMAPIPEIHAQCEDLFPLEILAAEDCPQYYGRVVKDIDISKPSPYWLTEKLRRSGIRSIDPVVDVTNYVMLEMGQPMHAFDLKKLSQGIVVRKAKPGEKLVLLDGQEITLESESLLIADHEKPLSLAGIMGGSESGVSAETCSVFLESAFFAPELIAGRARRYGLHTDSSHRFERGVDPQLQLPAIHRATELLLEIVGGQAGPIVSQSHKNYVPKKKELFLSQQRLKKILGLVIDTTEVEQFLLGLGMEFIAEENGWQVKVPTARFDITQEVDLIEEVARIYGYGKIPSSKLKGELMIHAVADNKVPVARIKACLADRGYFEAITYSFVEEELQKLVDPKRAFLPLLNPLSQELAVMRTSLWPGLLRAMEFNQNRQQSQIKLFEVGLRFEVQENQELAQINTLAGLAWGRRVQGDWQKVPGSLDFFDVKGDLETLAGFGGKRQCLDFIPLRDDPSLHPGQAATLSEVGKTLGRIGVLHPRIAQKLGIGGQVILFELDLEEFISAKPVEFAKLSKYPAIRRDIAVMVEDDIPGEKIRRKIIEVAGELLASVHIFDVYSLSEIQPGFKSLAFGLQFQPIDRTLTDSEINELMDNVVKALEENFGARLRT